MTIQLPDWFKSYRPHQIAAIEEIEDAFNGGARVVVVDAPTGAGKTLIAESIRQRLNSKQNGGGAVRGIRSTYTCSTKSLQDQFARDYPYARILKGRANYPTELYPDKFNLRWDGLSCDDCTKALSTDHTCQWCASPDTCPYEMAKGEAVRGELAVVNTAYLLSEANYVGKLSGRDLIIADECDLLDSAVCGFVSFEVSAKRVKQLGLSAPRRVTVHDSWLEWVEEAEPVVKILAREAREKARATESRSDIRNANYLSGLCRKFKGLREGLESESWVYTGTRDRIEFKPIWADQVAGENLWNHGKKWLLMSATVINAEMMLGSLGMEERFSSILVASTFPVANRPIIYRPVANMKGSGKTDEDKATRDGEWEKLVPAINAIRQSHPNERVLVHTVSYQLASFLATSITDRMVTYTSAAEREMALKQFLALPGAILFAPSLDRGIDLPDDACRVQVIAKVPFPYLGDKQVSARLYGSGRRGRDWYTMEAVRTLVQMCGRAVRSETDFATTYILDQQFEWRLWGGNRYLFPKYWREALKWRG